MVVLSMQHITLCPAVSKFKALQTLLSLLTLLLGSQQLPMLSLAGLGQAGPDTSPTSRCRSTGSLVG